MKRACVALFLIAWGSAAGVKAELHSMEWSGWGGPAPELLKQ
jgi:hypothetical protein